MLAPQPLSHATAAPFGVTLDTVSPHSDGGLKQHIKALEAQADSYRNIISAMAATCRTLQARVRTLEVERYGPPNVSGIEGSESGPPSPSEPNARSLWSTPFYSGVGVRRRRGNTRSLSWPVSREEAETLQRDTQRFRLSRCAENAMTTVTESMCNSPLTKCPGHPLEDVSIDAMIFEKACLAWF